MKYVIVLPDGAADDPLPALGGRTPLQAAAIPNMDWVAMNGRQGRIITVPEGYTPGTDVATLNLFGYDPAVSYSGRAPLEAAAQGLSATADQLIFRCNFVTIEEGRMKDFTAGHVDQPTADALVAELNGLLADELCEFHAGVSYRNLMLLSNATDLRVTCQPPHDIPNQPVGDYMPKGEGAARIVSIMERAAEMLAGSELNAQRIEAGGAPVTNIWLWGQGRPVTLEPFDRRYGPRGAVITGVDIIRGIAVGMGMRLIEVPGATGYLDTDYAAKGRAGVAALEDPKTDLVVVHVEAPDEAGHEGDAKAKIEALQRTDELIVGPLLQAARGLEEWRMLIAPDHPTPCATRSHSAAPPPFCFAGTGVGSAEQMTFSEANAAQGDLFIRRGHELMEMFISR